MKSEYSLVGWKFSAIILISFIIPLYSLIVIWSIKIPRYIFCRDVISVNFTRKTQLTLLKGYKNTFFGGINIMPKDKTKSHTYPNNKSRMDVGKVTVEGGHSVGVWKWRVSLNEYHLQLSLILKPKENIINNFILF